MGAGQVGRAPIVYLQRVQLRRNYSRRRQHWCRAAPLCWVAYAARHHVLRELRRQVACASVKRPFDVLYDGYSGLFDGFLLRHRRFAARHSRAATVVAAKHTCVTRSAFSMCVFRDV